jgi:hypothetical protein
MTTNSTRVNPLRRVMVAPFLKNQQLSRRRRRRSAEKVLLSEDLPVRSSSEKT